MKVNAQVLSIPPYISCPWHQVSSLCVETLQGERYLIVYMQNGSKVRVPDPSPTLVDMVFTAHGEFLDKADRGNIATNSSASNTLPNGIKLNSEVAMNLIPMPLGMGSFVDLMQHSSEQKNMPDLPRDILDKVVGLLRSIASEEIKHMPKAEPHCNCFHCQVSRKAHMSLGDLPEDVDAPVSDEELQFRSWDVKAEGEKVFTVTNPLDETESFSVYLGNPVGCTCGQNRCAHIEAALRS